MTGRIIKSDREWRDQLTSDQYYVCRQQGTEAPFSGRFDQHTEQGIYHCVCCRQALFDSDDKFDAGCGWPSYTKPVTESTLAEYEDISGDRVRTEVRCSCCDAHLGHVFPHASATGLRYCINSAALLFEKKQ